MLLTRPKTAAPLSESMLGPLARAAKKVLLGGGEKALTLPRIITHTGAIDYELLNKLHPPPTGFIASHLQNLKHILTGNHGLDVLKQRFQQGGIAGRGGLVHGAYALSPGTVNIKNFPRLFKEQGVLNTLKQHGGDALVGSVGDAANLGWMAALPAYGTYKALERGDPAEAGRTLGETAGWMLGAPLGAAGALVASPLSRMGSLMYSPKMPQMGNTQYEPQYETAQDPRKYGSTTSLGVASLFKRANAMVSTAPKIMPMNIQPPPSAFTPSIFQTAPRPAGGQSSPLQTPGQPSSSLLSPPKPPGMSSNTESS